MSRPDIRALIAMMLIVYSLIGALLILQVARL